VGHRVQLLVTPSVADPEAPSALLRVAPELSRALVEVPEPTLPAAFGAAWEQASAGSAEAPLRSTLLRRNGHDVGLVLERSLDPGVSVVLLAAPPEALDHDAALYATILAQAQG
jgi:hypothetical protein